VSEFLPISSSGHLSIAQNLLHLEIGETDDLFFEVLLHLGTLLAVFVVYWKDIKEMVLEFFRTIGDVRRGGMPEKIPPARRLILLLIVATLPLVLVLPVQDTIEGLSGNTYFVGAALLVTGALLFASDRVRKGKKTERSAKLTDALAIGVGQAVATCPGISRSGTTITVGCFVGLDRKFAVRYSFLMSIPAVLGANLLTLKDAVEAGINWGELPVYLVGVVAAALVGYACIRLLKMIADKGKFGAFAYYCWAVGALTLVLLFIQN
jgi:undecaprenyl-diphosphatase